MGHKNSTFENRYTTDQEFASIKGLLKNNSGGSTKQRGHLLFTVGRDSHQHIMDDGRVVLELQLLLILISIVTLQVL